MPEEYQPNPGTVSQLPAMLHRKAQAGSFQPPPNVPGVLAMVLVLPQFRSCSEIITVFEVPSV